MTQTCNCIAGGYTVEIPKDSGNYHVYDGHAFPDVVR